MSLEKLGGSPRVHTLAGASVPLREDEPAERDSRSLSLPAALRGWSLLHTAGKSRGAWRSQGLESGLRPQVSTGVRVGAGEQRTARDLAAAPQDRSWWQRARIFRETPQEHEHIQTSLALADDMVAAAQAELASGDGALVAELFGVRQGSAEHSRVVRRLRRHFRGIDNVAGVAPIIVTRKDSDLLAYVRGGYPLVFVTTLGLAESVGDLAETLVHEFSHAANSSGDYAYEFEDKFGKLETWQRTLNAEHVGLFARRAYENRRRGT